MCEKPINFLNQAAQVVYDKKGANILALEVKEGVSLTEYVLIAEGSVQRHVSAIAHAILNHFSESPVRVEGLKSGDWVILDYFHVVIHLFCPGLREKYALEKLENMGDLVDLKIRV
jgi:ribosome-associated protein